MTDLLDIHRGQGARLAGDGIPLDYGDQAAEYHAALNAAVLMDRSHEGRLTLVGRDRLALMHRMSTNDLESLAQDMGCATLFTTPNARILDRAQVFNRGDDTLVLTEPGRGPALQTYLPRNIFFNDEVRLADLAGETHQFVLHGLAAGAVLSALDAALADVPLFGAARITLAETPVYAVRVKPVSGDAWTLIVPRDRAAQVWMALIALGEPHGLHPAGSLTYNTLRIRAGRPAARSELTDAFIPLELGLWDEVSFSKGCYTGQEIIARMESRGRLARTIVRLRLDAAQPAPADLMLATGGRSAGTLTSSVTTPDGEHLGIGVVRMAHAQVGAQFKAGETTATVVDLAGVQPVDLREEDEATS
ncbi:MAG: folate-binding protein YgfZ [Anaerolineae bacterium]|nr:folate-binding protein YgfZ [Anaerolineae bacterium]